MNALPQLSDAATIGQPPLRSAGREPQNFRLIRELEAHLEDRERTLHERNRLIASQANENSFVRAACAGMESRLGRIPKIMLVCFGVGLLIGALCGGAYL